MSALHPQMTQLSWGITWACVLVVALGAWRGRRSLLHTVGPVRPGAWAGLGLILLVQALVIAWVVPHAPWHSFHHGEERFAGLRDLSWSHDALAASQHGPTWYVLVRLASLITPDLFAADAVLSIVTTAVGFLVARGLLGDDHRALSVAAVHAWLPVRLRVAPTLTLYGGVELALLVALLAALVHLRDRRSSSFAVALAALLLAMSSHLELLPLAPLAVLALVVARDPGWLVEVLPRRSALLALAGFVALLLPRLLVVILGPPDLLPGRPDVVSPLDAEARWRLLLALGALVALALLRLAPPTPPPRLARALPWLAAGAALLVAAPGLQVLVDLGGRPFVGEPRVPGAGLPWREAHALLSPDATPAPWPALALVGLGWALVARPEVFRLLALVLLPIGLLHAAYDDALSTYVRMALVAAWPFSVAVGCGLGVLTAPLGRLRPLGVLLPAAALGAYVPWLAWAYPTQRELPSLLASHDHVAAGGTVILPTPGDVPEDLPSPDRFPLAASRAYLGRVVGDPAGQVLGLREALAAPDLPSDAWLLLPLACHEALAEAGGSTTSGPPEAILLGGRAWRWTPDGHDPFSSIAPCLHRPELATCTARQGDRCALWQCPEALPPAASTETTPAYEDPLCAAARSTLAGPLIAEHLAPGPGLSNAYLAPGARVRLYRVRPRDAARR